MTQQAVAANLFFDRERDGSDHDRAMSEAEARYLAEQARVEREEAASGAFLARLAPFANGQPPSAGELGIDVSGLPERRATLVRFVAWLEQTRKQYDDLEAGRAAYLAKLGVPALTREKIEQIIAKDKHGIMAFMRSRGEVLTDLQIQAFEKARLEEKLQGDEYEANLAREAIAEADADLVFLRAAIEALEKRHEIYVKLALIDEAEVLGETYATQIAALQDTLRQLLGLGATIGATGGFWGTYGRNEFNARFPTFDLAAVPGSSKWPLTINKTVRPEIAISEDDATEAAEPWKARQQALLRDPRS